MSKILTTEIILERFKKAHGGIYDYSKVEYINVRTKVIIICKEHGKFEQSPDLHFIGRGCMKCGIIYRTSRLRKTQEDFIAKSKFVHSNLYDYSKTIYIDCKTKVIIICDIHGEFKQNPSNHLSGQGCRECGLIKRAAWRIPSTDNWIKRVRKVHGDKYDYSKSVYIKSEIQIIIGCPTHGEFEQLPQVHLRSGCPLCGKSAMAKNQTSNLKDFIKKSNTVHNNYYDYSESIYKKAIMKLIIICPIHGKFRQSPHQHFTGRGCPTCSKSKGELSIIKYLTNKKEEFVKEKKFKGLVSNLGNPLRYDFYLPISNILIEFDGIQHKKHNKTWMSKRGFKKLQYHDQLKNQYAKDNDIQLIRITNIEDVNKTLTKHLL